MPIYEVAADQLRKIEETSFNAVGIHERKDLQRLMRSQIETIVPDVLIIAEEFGDFEDSKRRIDLLGIDRDAKLVIIELKRTEDGGHMELQALRYAAMVSTITFEQAVQAFSEFLVPNASQRNAEQEILRFLEWEEPNQDLFAQDVRIVLASAEFSKEITSTVLWLNDYGLDIRCLRLKPYKDRNRVLIDIEQVIPLPEASEYQIRVSSKNREERKARTTKKDYTKYDVSIYGMPKNNLAKRNAIFYVVKNLCEHGALTQKIAELIQWRPTRMFFSVEGEIPSEDFIKRAIGKLEMNGKVFDQNNWFCDDGELIFQDGKTYAFSKKWGGRWLQALKIIQENFPEANIQFSKSLVDL
jgi:hypothetical protein